MLPMEQFRIIRVKQKAAAAAKDYTVTLGWPPDLVEVLNHKDAGGVAVAVRGTTAAGVVCLLPTDAVAMVDDSANGITFLDDGFRFGQNTFFKDDGADLVFKCYRNLESNKVFALSDAGTTEKPFGSGKQFGVLETGFTLDKGQPVKHGEVEITED